MTRKNRCDLFHKAIMSRSKKSMVAKVFGKSLVLAGSAGFTGCTVSAVLAKQVITAVSPGYS